MLAGVGQALLNRPVGGALQLGAQRTAVRALGALGQPLHEADALPRGPGLRHQFADPLQIRLRPGPVARTALRVGPPPGPRRTAAAPVRARLLVLVLAEHVQDVAQLLQRLVGVVPDDGRALRDLLVAQGRGLPGGGALRPVGERARVHRQQRDPVRQHVVHLPGDGPPLRPPRVGQTAPVVGLRTRRVLAQLQHQLPPDPGQTAPDEEEQVVDDHEGGHRPALVVRRPVQQDVRQGRREVQQQHRPRRTGRGAQRQIEDDDGQRAHHGVRQRGGGHGGQRDTQRPAPPHPQRQARHRTQRRVQGQQPARQERFRGDLVVQREPAQHGPAEQHDVDHPVPRTAPHPPAAARHRSTGRQLTRQQTPGEGGDGMAGHTTSVGRTAARGGGVPPRTHRARADRRGPLSWCGRPPHGSAVRWAGTSPGRSRAGAPEELDVDRAVGGAGPPRLPLARLVAGAPPQRGEERHGLDVHRAARPRPPGHHPPRAGTAGGPAERGGPVARYFFLPWFLTASMAALAASGSR
ncbi:hypothetical protein STAL104432_30360 [Streptomyces albus]